VIEFSFGSIDSFPREGVQGVPKRRVIKIKGTIIKLKEGRNFSLTFFRWLKKKMGQKIAKLKMKPIRPEREPVKRRAR